jgi:hypothetical protein
MKTTQRDIRQCACDIDVTGWSAEDLYNLLDDDGVLRTVATSCGIYGVNGVVVQLLSGKIVKSVGRTNATLILV